MSHRIEQVASTLQRAIQEVLARGLQDPRLGGMITVTEVHVSPDLRNATVQVSVMPHEKEKLSLHALRDASRHIRRRVGDLVSMKHVPDLAFRLDERLKVENELSIAMAKVAAERAASGHAEPAESGDDGAPEEAPKDEEGAA
jgi:ribosome-binding factor A